MLSTSELFSQKAVSPLLELGAYEELWMQERQSFKNLATLLHNGNYLPSDLVEEEQARKRAQEVFGILKSKNVDDTQFLIQGTFDYPKGLCDAQNPVQFLYYRGNLNLLDTQHRVALVGSRKASDDGIRRARKLAALLAKDNVTVVSGLAAGIDTAAHEATIKAGGQTIAVLGTPISETYPHENKDLQEYIARHYLVISQVPIVRHMKQFIRQNRIFFPERNATMSALTHATVIVEASETSGSLIQARAAYKQGRQLFILDSCFNKNLKWPQRLVEEARAIRVSDYEQIKESLKIACDKN